MTGYDDYTIAPNFEVPVAKTPPTEPAMPPSTRDRDPLDIVERVAVLGIQPGDVIVFESRENADDEQVDRLARRIQEVLGDDTLSIVINGKLGGVLRREGNILVESTSFSDLAKGRRTHLVGDEPR